MLRKSTPLLLALVFFAGLAGADTSLQLQRAKELLAEFEKADAARQEAVAAGDAARADAQGAAARKALLDALKQYEDAGFPEASSNSQLMEYAKVTTLLGFHDLTAEAMEVAVKRAPADAKGWALLGASAIECGPKHEPRGLEALKKSLTLDATSKDAAAAHLALGRLYYAQHLPDLASESLEKAVQCDPENAEAVLRRAVLLVRQGKILDGSNAIDALGKAAQPLDAMTRVLLRESLADYENSGGYFEDTHDNHAAFAKLLYRAGRLPEAILAGGRAAKLDPRDTKNLNFVGSMYMQSGNADGARQAYEKSLEADPNQPGVAEALKQLPPPAAATPVAPAPASPQAPAPPPLLQK